jgi:hypothetical protein
MAGINIGRWLAGGVVAGAVIWLLEGASSMLYFDDMQTALQAHDLAMDMTAAVWALTVMASLILGLALVFFYAAARPRFGPGPKTAAIVAVAMWFGSTLLSLLGYHMLNLYPMTMLGMWALVGLAELIVAALVGGWIYREQTA